MLVSILSLLGLSSLRTILTKVLIYGLVGLTSWIFIWFSGYNYAKDKFLLQAKQNEIRLTESIAEYKRSYETTLDKLNLKQVELDEQLKKQDEEAVADPGSSASCISPDGLHRLNQGFGYR